MQILLSVLKSVFNIDCLYISETAFFLIILNLRLKIVIEKNFGIENHIVHKLT